MPGDGPTFRPVYDTDFTYRISAVVDYNDVGAASTDMVVNDAAITRIVSAYSDPYYDFIVSGNAPGLTLTALDATGVFVGNRLTRVSNGTCRVRASTWLKSEIFTCNMTRINDNQYDILRYYESGSLARHMVDLFATLIGSKTSTSKPIYSTQNHTSPSYTRNIDCWAYPINATAISPWNSRGSNTRAGTAISPRHIILAEHYPLAINDTIRFITSDNVVITRTISNVQQVANYDLQIAVLDADLPGTITPLKVPPANVLNYLPSIALFPIPLLATDQEEKALTKETWPTNWNSYGIKYGAFQNASTDPTSRMTETIIGGDSGNPVCMLINGEAVLISDWFGPYLGLFYPTLISEINSAITTLGGGHTLSTVDLSSFTSYA